MTRPRGNRLRAYRIGALLLAKDVAEQPGVSRAVVCRMEKVEIVKIETLERLAHMRGSPIAWSRFSSRSRCC